jgi:TPR repeat protein
MSIRKIHFGQANFQRMGMLNLLGQKGFPLNIQEGVKLLYRSAARADLDSPQGAYVFALLLIGELDGVEVPEAILPQDEHAAKRMLEKASNLGFSHAQLKLGTAYENGTWGCEYDPQLSLHYYTLAARQGLSRILRADFRGFGSYDGIEQVVPVRRRRI